MKQLRNLVLLFLLTAAPAFAQEWQSLFDGKSFAGWRVPSPNPWWSVQDGTLVGVEDPEKVGNNLETEKQFKDFLFEAEVRWNAVTDSGFLFRKDQRVHVNIGMSPSMKRDMTASLYLIKAGAYVAEAKVEKIMKPGEWNKFRVEMRGNKITVWMNGERAVEHEQDKFTEAGPIGLQIHRETPGMKVEFRDLRVQDLASK